MVFQKLQITPWVSVSEYWIGLNDLETEMSFVWESGRSLSDDIKTHWEEDQPNNFQGEDHCVKIYNSNEMWDTKCSKPFPSVCQKRTSGEGVEVLFNIGSANYCIFCNLQMETITQPQQKEL